MLQLQVVFDFHCLFIEILFMMTDLLSYTNLLVLTICILFLFDSANALRLSSIFKS